MTRLKLRFLNSDIGISGSLARNSIKTKIAAATTVPISKPMIVGELQEYWFPPHDVKRIRHDADVAMKIMPK